MTGKDVRIYIGNLPNDVREKDLEDVFDKYGRIKFIDIKNRRGPPFAFVEYEDPRDAEDAVRGRDGYDFDGYRLRVEFPRGVGPRGPGGRPIHGGGGGGGDYRGDRDGYRGGGGGGERAPMYRRGGPPPKRTGNRVIVSGLPPTGSWQDLKDHMREAGDVCYADVFGDGSGVVEYIRSEDCRRAIRKLDDTKFRSHEGETAYVRVKEDTGHGRSRSRSPGGGGRRSPAYSPRRSRSRSPPSRSRSRSPRSRSPSRSRSRSRS